MTDRMHVFQLEFVDNDKFIQDYIYTIFYMYIIV